MTVLLLLMAGLAAPPDGGSPAWTPGERAYLDARGPVRVCADPGYFPFDFTGTDGRHQGIAADLLAEISAMTGLAFELVPSERWTHTLQLARDGACDIVAMLNETPARSEYLTFTRPYVTFENAIVTHAAAYHRGVASLTGRTVALPEDYRLVELIAQDHPTITVLPVADMDAALRAVSRGEAYATLVNQQQLVRGVQQLRLRNLHFAGSAELEDHYRIGVRRDDPMLHAVLDRALSHVSPAQVSQIMERWYVVPVQSTVDFRLVGTVAGVATVMLAFLLLHLYHRQRYLRLLVRRNEELAHLSSTDPLTQAANRRGLDARLLEEVTRARRHGRPLSVIIFDLDNFKQINDTLGHQTGDTILVELAALARQQQRLTDILGRYGGDEFVVICPETGADDARRLGERLCRAVAAQQFAGGVPLTLSAGAASLEPDDTPGSFLRRADEALYHAKAQGRDRVATAAPFAPAGSR